MLWLKKFKSSLMVRVIATSKHFTLLKRSWFRRLKRPKMITNALCFCLAQAPFISWAAKKADEPVVIPLAGGLVAGFTSADEIKTYILIPIVSFMAREVYQYWKDSKNKVSEKIDTLTTQTNDLATKLDHLTDLLEHQDREYDRRMRHIEGRL